MKVGQKTEQRVRGRGVIVAVLCLRSFYCRSTIRFLRMLRRLISQRHTLYFLRNYSFQTTRQHLYSTSSARRPMGKKNKSNTPSEDYLSSLSHSTTSPIVDTHTHLASTFALYRGKYKEGKYDTVYDFVRGMYQGKNVEAIVDVWCEAPVQKLWKEFADSALTDEDRKTKWGGLEYWFVMGESSVHVERIR